MYCAQISGLLCEYISNVQKIPPITKDWAYLEVSLWFSFNAKYDLLFQLTRYRMSDEPLSKLHRACADDDIYQVKKLLTSHSNIRDAVNKSDVFECRVAAIHPAVEHVHKEVSTHPCC